MIIDDFAHRGLRDFEEEQVSRYEAELDNMAWRHDEQDMDSYHRLESCEGDRSPSQSSALRSHGRERFHQPDEKRNRSWVDRKKSWTSRDGRPVRADRGQGHYEKGREEEFLHKQESGEGCSTIKHRKFSYGGER